MTQQYIKQMAVALLGIAPLLVSNVYATPTTPAITFGQIYQGGIVFYVDQNGSHGLIAAMDDQSSEVTWSNVKGDNLGYKVTGTKGDGLYAGAMNTTLIVAEQMSDNQAGNFAAKVAADYSVQADGVTPCLLGSHNDCYGDWYLPSATELDKLLQARTVVTGLPVATSYWTSTECRTTERSKKCALTLEIEAQTPISTTISASTPLKNTLHAVRAIRQF